MIAEQLGLFFQIYRRPLTAMSRIVDQGHWLFAVGLMLLISLGLWLPGAGVGMARPYRQPVIAPTQSVPAPPAANAADDSDDGPEVQQGRPAASLRMPVMSFYVPLLLLMLLFIPGIIVTMILFGEHGSFNTLLQRDYGALLTCLALGWAATRLPTGLAALAIQSSQASPLYIYALDGAQLLAFAALAVCAVRVIYGATYPASIGAASVGAALFIGGVIFYAPFGFLLRFLASPFLLYYGYQYFGGDVRSVGQGLRSRQNYRRCLEAATLNPHDADAQYQLGLIYQQRRQNDEAIRRFEKAASIDPREPDAFFQLARIANEQGRWQDALANLQKVATLDPKHSSYEVWRELGRTQLALGQLEDARYHLQHYAGQRPYDPEGLYFYGMALKQSGEAGAAAAAFRQAIEAVQTAPGYRRRLLQKWARLARKAI